MSKDNGTYILVLKNGYKVCQMHAVENLLDNVDYVLSAYDERLLWSTKEKALNYALTLEMEAPTEYGVLYIQEHKNKTWMDLQCANQDSPSSPRAAAHTALGRSKR